MGVVWLVLLAALVALNGWLLSGAFGPLRDLPETDWVLVLRPAWHLGIWWLASLTVLVAAHAAIAKRTFGAQSLTSAFAWPCMRLWAPLLLLALPPLAMAMLATPLRMVAPPWLYLFVDLRWWLAGGVALLVALGFDAASGQPTAGRVVAWFGATRMRSPGALWLEVSLVALLAVASLATSPRLRFQSAVLGDEPKYLRYLENWYRGRGFDIVGLVPISELPANHRSDVLGNLHQVTDALSWMAADLAADARRMAGLDAPPRPGPAKSEGGWFVEGKRGGVYQVHSPGFSLLLFPGYFVDRTILNWTSTEHPQFPTNLFCTNGSVLILYLLWGVAVFRLLWAYTGRALMTWIMTCVVMLSLPSTAFSYQYYPEVAAGLAVALIVPYVLLSSDGRPGVATAYGVLVGYLPWLHVRFGLLTILAGLCLTITRRRVWPAVIWFWIGAALPLAALGAYHYHVTGNPMPWAVFALTREARPFGAWSAAYDLPSFWFDWSGGLPAHAPVYLLALPGLWLSWRRNHAVAAVLALFVLALAIPAAGHGWMGGGTTPLRLVAAVIPLLALPLADAIERYVGSRWFLVTLVVLGAISVQNGLTYNGHFDKGQPWLLGPTISGWLSPLLLPNFDVNDRLAHPFIWVWIVAAVVLVASPALVRRAVTRSTASAVTRRSWTAVTATVLIIFAALASITGASLGYTSRSRFMMEQAEVRDWLLLVHQIDGSGPGWSARRGPIEMATLFPNAGSTRLDLRIEPTDAMVQTPVGVSVGLAEQGGTRGWGTLRVDFGDGSPVSRLPVVGEVRTSHRYATAGEYGVTVDVTLPGGPPLRRTGLVRVGRPDASETPFDLQASLGGFEPDPMTAPVTMRIESVMVQGSRLELRCRSTREPRHAGFWVWLLTDDDPGVRRARLHDVSPVVGSDDPRTFLLSLVPRPELADKALVGVVVGARTAGSRNVTGRSELVSFRQPAAILTIGSGVVVGPFDRVP